MRNNKFSNIERIIQTAKKGGIYILVDDENRENEGDLAFCSSDVTPKRGHIDRLPSKSDQSPSSNPIQAAAYALSGALYVCPKLTEPTETNIALLSDAAKP